MIFLHLLFNIHYLLQFGKYLFTMPAVKDKDVNKTDMFANFALVTKDKIIILGNYFEKLFLF